MKAFRAWPLLLVLGLVACGGKKTTAPTPSATTVNLSGTAYKGILQSAEVSAYEVINGAVSATALKTVSTDANGNYSLDLAPTANPVVVKVKTTSSTTMMDESQIQSNGSFNSVQTGPDVEMRSFIPQLQENTIVMINPITEQVLVLAEKTKGVDGTTAAGLTADVLLMTKATVREALAGDDAFTTAPPSNASEIAANAVHAVVIGLAYLARTETSCAMACQIEKISGKNNTDFGATLNSSGTLTLTTNAVFALQQPIKTAASQAVAALGATDAATAIQTASDSVANATVSATSPTVTEINARNSFEAFIAAMRDGFKQSDTSLRAEGQALEQRYQNSTVTATSHLSELLSLIGDHCMNGDTLSCSSADGITWAGSSANGYSFTGTRNGNAVSGKISGTFAPDTSVNLALNDVVIANGGKNLFTASAITAVGSLTETGGTLTVNGTMVGYDTAANSNRTVTLALSNIEVSRVPGNCPEDTTANPINCKESSTAMTGVITMTADAGDVLTGELDIASDEWQIVDTYHNGFEYFTYTSTKVYPTKYSLKLSAKGSNKSLASLNISMTSEGRSAQGEEMPLSAENFSSNSGSFTMSLIEGSERKVTVQHTTWDEVSGSVMFKAGGSQMTASTVYKANVEKTPEHHCRWISGTEFCADTLAVESADKTYTAALKRVNGKVNGDIKKGEVKVAEVKDGIVYANGKKVSLY